MIQIGDFLKVEYTLKVKDTGKTIDTTSEEKAKGAGIYREDQYYGPRFLVQGEGVLPKGLEEAMMMLELGKTLDLELSPEKGYGLRDPSMIHIMPIMTLAKLGINPIIGGQVRIGNKTGIIRTVGAGRVLVDYNHPLAGKTLLYDVRIEMILQDREEKIKELIIRSFPEEGNKFTLEWSNQNLTIIVPEDAFYLRGLAVSKRAIANDIAKYLPEIGSISFRETVTSRSLAMGPLEPPKSEETSTVSTT